MSDRYVLLGLAPARSAWFDAVARWSTSASLAAEFVKCVSAEEVRVRLSSGRRHSALLVDASLPSFDRDLVDAAVALSTPVIAVRDRRGAPVAARDLGVAAELPGDFGRDELLEVLAGHCRMVGRGEVLPPALADPPAGPWTARMLAVCGCGGTGASTVAIAVAQGLAADARHGGRVVLADLALRADQAMLHDAVEVGPGVQELVEGHRLGRMAPEEVRTFTFDVPRRGYRLLLGLRQPEAWSALRPRATDAALEGLRSSFQVVVADVTGDVEGEGDGGSVEVEERNHLARAATQRSSVVLAVGAPGMKGVHSLARLVRDLVRSGVDPGRVLPVLNRSPRSPRARADWARALSGLLAGGPAGPGVGRPVHVPERRLEEVLRDGEPLPGAVVAPLARAVDAAGRRGADAPPARPAPARVEPGSLGSWAG